MSLFNKCPVCASRLNDDGDRVTQAEWLLNEGHRLMSEAQRMRDEGNCYLEEAKATGKRYEELLARGRSVLGASTNEEYFTRLSLLIQERDGYKEMLVSRAVAESMRHAYSVTMSHN